MNFTIKNVTLFFAVTIITAAVFWFTQNFLDKHLGVTDRGPIL